MSEIFLEPPSELCQKKQTRVLMFSIEAMSTPPPIPNSSFFHKAATASLFALPLSILVKTVSSAGAMHHEPAVRQISSFVVAVFAALLLLLGFSAGIVSLFGIRKYGTKGILWKALVGTLLPLTLMILAFPVIAAAKAKAEKSERNSDLVEERLAALAVEATNKAPVRIDSDTLLISAEALPGKMIQYNYKIARLASDFRDNILEERLRPKLLSAYNASPEMRTFRDNGVTVIYRYTDQNGVLVDEFRVGPGAR